MEWGSDYQQGNQGQQGADSLSDDEGKPSHRDTEKRRRQLITENVTTLRNLVPGSERRSRSVVLIDTVSYIQKIQAENNQLRSALAQAEKNITSLFNTNTRLISQVRAVQDDNARLRGLAAAFLPEDSVPKALSPRSESPEVPEGHSPGSSERKRKRWTEDTALEVQPDVAGTSLFHQGHYVSPPEGSDVKPRIVARPRSRTEESRERMDFTPLGLVNPTFSVSSPDVSFRQDGDMRPPRPVAQPFVPGPTFPPFDPSRGPGAFLQPGDRDTRRRSMPAPPQFAQQPWPQDDGTSSPRKRQRTGLGVYHTPPAGMAGMHRLSAPSAMLGERRRFSTGDMQRRDYEPTLPTVHEPTESDVFSVFSGGYDEQDSSFSHSSEMMRLAAGGRIAAMPMPLGHAQSLPPSLPGTLAMGLGAFSRGDAMRGDGMRGDGMRGGDPTLGMGLSVPISDQHSSDMEGETRTH